MNGRKLLFLDEDLGMLENTTLISTRSLYSTENIALASSFINFRISFLWVDFYVYSVVVGALPLTFWLATKKFELIASNIGESVGREETKSILHKYYDLKIITRLMNSIWATLLLNIVLEYALVIVSMHQINLDGKQLWFVYISVQLACMVLGLLLMAEGCRVVSFSETSVKAFSVKLHVYHCI